MRRILLLTLTVALAPLAHAWDVQPFTASYKFTIDSKLGTLNGSATRTLEKTGTNSYRYVFAATAPLASATETSNFTFDGKTVTSSTYEQKSKVAWFSKLVGVNFDWKNNTAKGTRDGKEAQYALKPGTLDSLNMEIQVRRDLNDDGKTKDYWLASAKDMSSLQFESQGEEVLDTPIGKLKTIKLKRMNQGERVTTMWLAKDLGYMPAKVQQNDDGNLYTIEVDGYKPTK